MVVLSSFTVKSAFKKGKMNLFERMHRQQKRDVYNNGLNLPELRKWQDTLNNQYQETKNGSNQCSSSTLCGHPLGGMPNRPKNVGEM
jgi:hypothetical protein